MRVLDFSLFPVYGFLETFLLLSCMMVFRYFLLCGAFQLLCLQRARKLGAAAFITGAPDPLRQRQDIRWSLISSLIFAFSGAMVIRLLQTGHIKLFTGFSSQAALWGIVTLTLLMLVHETYFYWSHRLIHHPKLFRRVHWVHHESRTPSAWTAFAFHPYEALIQAAFLPLVLFMVPVHWVTLVIFLSLMSILGVINHLGQEIYPAIAFRSPGLRWFINATHHQRHHQRMNFNFGLYFTIWDELMGTELKEAK